MNRHTLLSQSNLLTLRCKEIANAMQVGQYRSIFRGSGIEFEEVREYNTNDDSRMIDWNVTSRTGKPYVKLFCEQRELNLQILFDESLSMQVGSCGKSYFSHACETLALLLFACEHVKDKSSCAFFSATIRKWIKPSKGKKHILTIIDEALSNSEYSKTTDLANALDVVQAGLKKKSLIIILSDFFTSNWGKNIAHLAKNHDVICVCYSQKTFPLHYTIPLYDPETGKTLLAPFHSKFFKQSLFDFQQNKIERLTEAAKKYNFSVCIINLEDDPARVLTKFFLKRDKR